MSTIKSYICDIYELTPDEVLVLENVEVSFGAASWAFDSSINVRTARTGALTIAGTGHGIQFSPRAVYELRPKDSDTPPQRFSISQFGESTREIDGDTVVAVTFP